MPNNAYSFEGTVENLTLVHFISYIYTSNPKPNEWVNETDEKNVRKLK